MKSLKQTITESSKRYISLSDLEDLWDRLKDLMGAERMLDEIGTSMSSDEKQEMIEWIDRNYDFGLFDEEDEE